MYAELDFKLAVSLQTTGARNNIHDVRRMLLRLEQSNSKVLGKYVNFDVWPSWGKYLHHRVTFSRPRKSFHVRFRGVLITRSLWIKVKSQFLHETAEKVQIWKITDELIINVEKTSSKFVANGRRKGENGISHYGLSGKWSKTLTLGESDNGIILSFQPILIK